MLGFGGRAYLITGIKATKAIMRAAREPMRSPSVVSWKKIPKFMMPSSQSGIKIVDSVTKGNL